ncbi:histidine kinase [Ureibacillus manganicus DSM 26584]|uniref:histidine kinase n=2 Tax=Ureibacillus TaxID=160795 RepID=A0A0A3HZV4_9BACL|nr:histidine kinase [Ureibacillus manganicus DSM 26584]
MAKKSLKFKMFLFSFVIVFFSILTSGMMMIHNISGAFEKEFGSRAIAIARTVANMTDIQDTVGTHNGFEVIQPIAERIRLATDVDYIVVFDMDGVRYSHPSESRIGTIFEEARKNEAMSQREYISKAIGVQGHSIRAFVPIMNSQATKQVGVVIVGILSPTWFNLLSYYQSDLYISLFWGLLVGVIGAIILANHIKKQTLNLEPYQIARIVQERSAIMQAMDVGILATDANGKITFINRIARQYTHYFGKNSTLQEIFYNTWLAEKKIERHESYRPLLLFDQMYLVRTFPILIHDKNAGYLIMITDRQEAHTLAEELTGVKALVDSLRAQHHEFLNRLHSIAGLIQLDRNEDALSLIIDEITDEEDVVQKLRDKILEYSMQGLLLGKHSRAKELGVHLTVDDESYFLDFMTGFSSGDLVTIIGNLIDNAMEACLTKEIRDVNILIQGDQNFLYIEVQDSGKGIEGNLEKIFEYGFTSKQQDGHGIGLALVKQIVESNKGSIEIMSEVNIGTTITVKAGVMK